MKKIILLLSLTASLFGQTFYTATKTTALSGAAEVITVQQPATASRDVLFDSVYFDCSVACVITLERNGTAATTTALTANPINTGDVAAVTLAYNTSNVGTGTVIAKFNCVAACAQTIDLTGIKFKAGQTTSTNITLRSSSITGTVDITFKFKEVQ